MSVAWASMPLLAARPRRGARTVVALDVLWNVALGLATAAVVAEAPPRTPLRLWTAGYAVQCLFHAACVIVEHSAAAAAAPRGRGGLSVECHAGIRLARHLESAATAFSFLWWIIGFYSVSTGGQRLTKDAPLIYWLCVSLLAFDVFFVVFCIALACIVGVAACCCLPCIMAILYALLDQECRICLTGYEDGAEVLELPCSHHFHLACVGKWMRINASCPLCKCSIMLAYRDELDEV